MTIKIVLSSPLRTLPQSLRDSSLPEGAFEKFAAVLFGSRRLFYAGDHWSPLQKQQDLIVACRGDHILAKQVCYEAKRNIESPVSLFALSFGFAQTNDCPQTL